METYKTNSSQVKIAVLDHIYEFYDDKDSLYDDVKAAGGIQQLIEGGSFLVYYNDQRKFIEGLHLNNKSNKEFSDQQVWDLYKLLLEREITNLIGRI